MSYDHFFYLNTESIHYDALTVNFKDNISNVIFYKG